MFGLTKCCGLPQAKTTILHLSEEKRSATQEKHFLQGELVCFLNLFIYCLPTFLFEVILMTTLKCLKNKFAATLSDVILAGLWNEELFFSLWRILWWSCNIQCRGCLSVYTKGLWKSYGSGDDKLDILVVICYKISGYRPKWVQNRKIL